MSVSVTQLKDQRTTLHLSVLDDKGECDQLLLIHAAMHFCGIDGNLSNLYILKLLLVRLQER